ncbi:MAG: polysaccharide deacetylase family protein, partial [Flavisolibacter sp.]|nr:polysaccharide deacetylase family protein [Flavisolibacter sp.]
PLIIDCFTNNDGNKAFLATEGDTGFDLLAAIFYLLSRYEEYGTFQKDIYGRYAHQNSLAYKNNFLHLPLINIWLETFRQFIQQKFPNYKLQITNFKLLPTYDIDIAWSYRHKGFMRNAGGTIKSVGSGQWSMVRERVDVLIGRKKDPYDCYDWLDDIHKQYYLKPLYFFHVGQKRNRYDKNIPITNAAFQQLVQHIAKHYSIGLHPTWQSGIEPEMLMREKKILEEITGQQVTASRQHYIRFTLPEAYRRLIAAGITDDYSMGYGSINGFRASVASPFYWYDVEREEETNLLLHPFCFMDANSFFEQKYTPQQALEELMQFHQTIRNLNGTLIAIWHNSFLGTDGLYAGWKEVYAQFISTVCRRQS